MEPLANSADADNFIDTNVDLAFRELASFLYDEYEDEQENESD